METVKVGKSVCACRCMHGMVAEKVPEFDQIRYEGEITLGKRPLWRVYEPSLIKFLWWSYRHYGKLLAVVWFGDDRKLHVKAERIGWSEILAMFAQSLESKIETGVVFYDAVPTTAPPDEWEYRRGPA